MKDAQAIKSIVIGLLVAGGFLIIITGLQGKVEWMLIRKSLVTAAILTGIIAVIVFLTM
jgi:hypothetical protein